jgi:hypothetical protein
VLREEFKTFDRVYNARATVKKPEVIDDILKDINELPDVLVAEKSEDTIDVFSSRSAKFEIEKAIKDHVKDEKGNEKVDFRVTENSYISYVIVDIKDEEIIIESKDSFLMPSMAVGAAT